MKSITVGTRGSKLALMQTALVVAALKRRHPELDIETKIITTKGDSNQSPIPLDTVGKAWFTGEIEQALLDGEIDLAVHSLKDMTPESASGLVGSKLVTRIVLERADPRDVLISKSGEHLKDLSHAAIIGTDSIRRKVLLLDQRSDLVVKSIRGNVDTRIKKMHAEDTDGGERYDAIVLAAAGLERLGMVNLATEFFDPTTFSIAPGQGILAAQTRANETEIIGLLHVIESMSTRIAAEAELGFSKAIGGGCKLPIGCYAHIENDIIEIHGMMGDEQNADLVKIIRKSIKGPIAEASTLAERLARKFS